MNCGMTPDEIVMKGDNMTECQACSSTELGHICGGPAYIEACERQRKALKRIMAAV